MVAVRSPLAWTQVIKVCKFLFKSNIPSNVDLASTIPLMCHIPTFIWAFINMDSCLTFICMTAASQLHLSLIEIHHLWHSCTINTLYNIYWHTSVFLTIKSGALQEAPHLRLYKTLNKWLCSWSPWRRWICSNWKRIMETKANNSAKTCKEGSVLLTVHMLFAPYL